MSLPARQLHKLEEIEGGLTGSDPRLRSLFAIFTRLIRRSPAARVRALLLIPAAVSALVCGVMIAAGLTGAHRPSVSAKPPAARELILKTTRVCRLGMIRFPAMAC